MKRLSILALALLAAAPAFAMQSQQGPILLRAKGPIATKLPAGKPLPTGARVALASGDVLMLLDGRGVRTLAGPGILENGAFTRTGPAAIGGGERIGAVRGGPDGRARVASVRSVEPETWVVPLADMGAVCLPQDRELNLWRRAGPAAVIEVQPVAPGPTRTLAWRALAERFAWPDYLSTAPGTRYRLSSQALGGTREIEFRALSADDPACASQIDFNIKLAADAEEQMLDEYLN